MTDAWAVSLLELTGHVTDPVAQRSAMALHVALADTEPWLDLAGMILYSLSLSIPRSNMWHRGSARLGGVTVGHPVDSTDGAWGRDGLRVVGRDDVLNDLLGEVPGSQETIYCDTLPPAFLPATAPLVTIACRSHLKASWAIACGVRDPEERVLVVLQAASIFCWLGTSQWCQWWAPDIGVAVLRDALECLEWVHPDDRSEHLLIAAHGRRLETEDIQQGDAE